MKNSILIITEQQQSDETDLVSVLIQQAINAWLTKELRK